MASPPPDPRQLNRLLLAAFAGLVLLIAWNVAFAQALPQGTVLDPRELVTTSQRAIGRTIGDHAMRNLARYLAGGVPQSVVTLAEYDRST